MYCVGFDQALWSSAHYAWRLLWGAAGRQAGMTPSWLAVLAALGASCAVAAAVRLMDDHLDQAADQAAGTATTAAYLGAAALPYAMLAYAVAALLAPALAFALFAGAYAVGMLTDAARRLPLGLSGWQESVIVLLLGFLGTGVACMGWAAAFMIALQAWDDIADRGIDARSGARNLCVRFGVGETALVGAIGTVVAIALSPLLTIVACAAVPVANAWSGHTKGVPQ